MPELGYRQELFRISDAPEMRHLPSAVPQRDETPAGPTGRTAPFPEGGGIAARYGQPLAVAQTRRQEYLNRLRKSEQNARRQEGRRQP
jgi:hypothetical protein